jgi:hypothetical protein
MRVTLAILALMTGPVAAQLPVAEEIGTWRLGCVTDRMTDRAACQLRHRDWVERPGTGLANAAGLALEIQDRGGRLVPVVTARDLGLDGASRGLLALTGRVQMRFGASAMFEMACALEGRSLACFPSAGEAAAVERDFANAERLLVRVSSLGGGSSGYISFVGGTGEEGPWSVDLVMVVDPVDSVAILGCPVKNPGKPCSLT